MPIVIEYWEFTLKSQSNFKGNGMFSSNDNQHDCNHEYILGKIFL